MVEMTKEDREMDDLFHGEKKPLHPDTIHMTFRKPAVAVSKTENTTAAHYEEEVKDAQFEPAKPVPNQMDKLKACALYAISYGGLNFLIFYWHLAGLMDDSISIPCMWACMLMAGFGIGKSFGGRDC